MADFYATEFVGGPDGTLQPPKKLDGRLVSAKKRRTRATKPTTSALAVGDRLYLGKLPQGGVMHSIGGVTDTSLGTTTLSVGTTAAFGKYVNGKTLTTIDQPSSIGPKASAAVAGAVTADEDIWLTVGVAAIPAAVIAQFFFEYTIST